MYDMCVPTHVHLLYACHSRMPRTRVYTCVSCMSYTCASIVCLNVRHVCPPHVYLLYACQSPCLTLAGIHVYVCMYLLYACNSRMPHFRVYILSHTCASLVCLDVRHMCPPHVYLLYACHAPCLNLARIHV